VRAAVADKEILAPTGLVEMSAIVKRWHDELQSRYGLSAYRPDNIHLNVWGQMRLAWVLFSHAWPELTARVVLTSTQALASSNWESLKFGARVPNESGKEALEVVRLSTSSPTEDMGSPH
jgi:hypothetical protein